MFDHDLSEEDTSNTVFRDVIFLALSGFVAIVLLVIPHLNPPGTAQEGTPAPGNVIVELNWAQEVNADVDLWVEAPGDVPVGYSNKGGLIFNLLRDDLGSQSDVTKVNYEVSYSRGVPAGEYVINSHLFRARSEQLPLIVTVSVSIKASPQEGAKRILTTDLRLDHEGQELTAFRFSLNDEGELVPGSVHDLPMSLRNKTKKS